MRFQFLQSLFAIFPYIKQKLEKFKPSLQKEVFFSSLIILAIFLLISLFFNFDFLTSEVKSKFNQQDLFVKPANNFLRESPKMTLIGGNSLVGISPPSTIKPQVLGTVLGSLEQEAGIRTGIIEYIVEPGDNLSSIAAKYEISLETILWANELSSKSIIQPGQKLIILPVSGIVYHIKKGDTLSEIAETYKGKVSEIIEFNELSSQGDIFIGDILIIPNGEMPPPPKKSYYAASQVPLGSSYFICPHSARYITQGLHWYNAIDFGGKCGDPIYAAAAGAVQRVKYGWNAGAGNYLTILHPNGVVTMYGHLQKSLVAPGQQVSQGQIIALMGGQPGTPGAGSSTGCHVHFSVSGSRNPFAR